MRILSAKNVVNAIRSVLGKGAHQLHEPLLKGKEINFVSDTIKRNFVSTAGQYVNRFEKAIKKFSKSNHAIAVVNGTQAIFVSLKVLGVRKDDEVLVESFLDGTEVSVGVITYNTTITALPITEIVSENDFFDYEAKYNGQSQEITPARISDAQRDEVQQIAIKIYKTLKLKGLTRAEFIFHNNEPHFLEVNTCPGLSEASIIPQQAAEAGISLKDLFSNVIAAAMH